MLPGVDIVSVPDILRFLCDVTDRCFAPARHADRTRYILERDAANGIDDSEHARELAKFFPGLVGGGEEAFHARVRRYVREFARRDMYAALLDGFEQRQSDSILDAVLRGTDETHRLLGDLQMSMDRLLQGFAPCSPRNRAVRLLESCEHAKLKGAGAEITPIFVSDGDGVPRPRWGVAMQSSRVTGAEPAGYSADERLEVLRAVAFALHAAHKLGWAHRRLAMHNIVQVDEGGELVTKVLHFVNKLTVCHGAGWDRRGKCRDCDGLVDNLFDKREIDIFQSEKSEGEGQLFFDNKEEALADGQRYDVLSFARFLLWMYSGELLPPQEQLTLDERNAAHEDAVARVPWPLRFLVFDADVLRMDVIATFLHLLSQKSITPHGSVYFSPTGAYGAQSSRDSMAKLPDVDSALRELCIRSAEVGMRTAEPEAAMHLGFLLENEAMDDMQSRQLTQDSASRGCSPVDDVDTNIRSALDCYNCASELGEVSGFVAQARLKGRILLAGHVSEGRRRAELRSMLRLTLLAAVQGDVVACAGLAGFVRNGLQEFVDSLSSKIMWKAGEFVTEVSLVSVVAAIGCLLRRGRVAGCWALEHDASEALFWLDIASKRGHLTATLELGLLHVQRQESPAAMRAGVDLVMKAASAHGCAAALDAHFWLAHWYERGLDERWVPLWERESEDSPPSEEPRSRVRQVVRIDNFKAVSYAQHGTRSKHADCMDLLSWMTLSGLGSIESDENASNRLRDRALRRGSVRARVARSMNSLDLVVDRVDSYLRGMFRTVNALPRRNFLLNFRRSGGQRDAVAVKYLSVKSFDDLDVCQKLDAAIQDLTIAGERAVTKGILDLKDESLNPWPLYHAAERIRGLIDVANPFEHGPMALEENDALSRKWARFKRRKWCQALHWYKRASSVRNCPLYRETRINWLSKDSYFIEEAEKMYQQYKSQGSSNH